MPNSQYNALLRIDIQNDFMANSRVAVPNAWQIIDNVNILSKSPFFQLVIDIRDKHSVSNESFAKWGPHCIAGSPGYNPPENLYLDDDIPVFDKGIDDKIDTLSGFENKDLAIYLQKNGIKSVYLAGLALDYCVYKTACDSVGLGFETFIIIDACKAFNENFAQGPEFKASIKKLNIKLVSTFDVLKNTAGAVK